MCGIAGEVLTAFGSSITPDDTDVRRMVAAMHHRGPDGEGYRAGEGAVIGMCRLAIIDVAHGQQPISSADDRFHIVYNGECYDVDPLRRDLESKGVEFRTRTDTEVVLYTYIHYGPEGLNRLNGMFAFAIWDSEQRELFLARDRFGIKPLFYSFDGKKLVFASTLAAIRARHGFSGTVDPEAIELYLSTKFIPAPYSIFREVRKLPAGTWARLRGDDFQCRHWWDLPLNGQDGSRFELNDALERVEDTLQQAARCRLVSERPVGLCLSGGIDSGLLASVLQQDEPQSFSLGFDEGDFDESTTAGTVAAHLKLPFNVLTCHMDCRRDFADVVRHYDEPVADSSGVALYNLARLMSQHVTVAISGSGGDELFGGYMRYVGSRFAAWTHHIPGLASAAQFLGHDERKLGWRGRLARFCRVAAVEPFDCYLRFLNPTTPEIASVLRRPEFLSGLDGFRVHDVFRPHFEKANGQSLLRQLIYLDTKTVLTDDYLVKEDRMTMAHSVEGRVPFLDYRLVELAYRLPDRMKIVGLKTKRLLRQLARRRLPAAIASAPKQGFEIPEAAWLRGPLGDIVRESLIDSDARVKQFLAPNVVDRVVSEHLQQQDNHGRLLWTLLVLERWLREAESVTAIDPDSVLSFRSREADAPLRSSHGGAA